MKSPWKFLLDLASRRTATQQAKSAPEIETKTPKALLDHVVEAPVASIEEAAAPTDSVAKDSANDRALDAPPTVEEPVGGNEPSPGLADQAPALDQEHPSEDVTIKRQTRHTRLKRSIARNVAPTPRVEYGSANAHVPAPPMTFSEEVLVLDEDIRQLRRQLAEKLSSQNAQLKKMLERF